jgi:ligand-binding sensor domain-containing protein
MFENVKEDRMSLGKMWRVRGVGNDENCQELWVAREDGLQ